MKLQMPAFLDMRGKGALVRILLLMMVWGSAAFFWGSLGEWARHKVLGQSREMVRAQMDQMETWLKDLMEPVETLADDERLEAAVALPSGVESAPVQRVLYEFSYLHNAPDLYVVDVEDNTVGSIAGATPLKTEVMARLKALGPVGRVAIGAGERSGAMFLARKVAAPLPHVVYVVVPFTLSKAASVLPDMRGLPDGVSMGLMMPHTAGWGWWPLSDSRFELNKKDKLGIKGGVIEDNGGATILLPLSQLEGLMLGVKRERLVVGVAMVPQAILALLALAMTAVIFWKPSAPLRAKVLAGKSPVVVALRGVGKGVAMPFGFMKARLNAHLNGEMDPPLIEGPGDFMPGDFKGNARGATAGLSGWGSKPSAPSLSGRKIANPNDVKDSLSISKLPDLEELQRQQEERELKEVIKKCLREGRLSLLYQPIFRTSDNLPAMHEVFARLIKPDGEMMTPGQFLPTANKFGLTQSLDAAVFKKVLNTHFSGPSSISSKVALNVGGTSLDGIAYLQELLNNGVHALKNLAFEVRSQEIVRDPKALKLLKDIQKMGGVLSVDYFGGGRAMLEASKVMGFDYVKLDGIRFWNSEESKAELLDLLKTAKEIALPVVVERIEGPEVEDFVRKAGVDYLQGYGLARPTEELVMTPLTRGGAATPAASTAAQAAPAPAGAAS